MKIKSAIAGLIIATSVIAVGTSQACLTRNQPACANCTKIEGFTGKGWHMVSCNTCVRPAATWQQYVSGGYAPPVAERGLFFFR